MSDIDFGTMVDDNHKIDSDHDSVDTAATCRSDDLEVLTYMDRKENDSKIGGPRLSLEARRQSEIKSQSMIKIYREPAKRILEKDLHSRITNMSTYDTVDGKQKSAQAFWP